MKLLDAQITGQVTLSPGTTDWQTLTSTSFYDLSKTDELGDLVAIAEDLPYTLLVINCLSCTNNTFLKLCEPNLMDSTTNCLIVPAGSVFSLGLRGHSGANGLGIKTIGLKLAESTDTVFVTSQFDS